MTHQFRSSYSRTAPRGSVTAFGVVLALVLVTIGGGFLFFILFMGGQREVQNATDAGALNLGKQAPDQVSVILSPQANQQCFLDATSDTRDNSNGPDGKVNLRRINKVWAEAMLMNINATAAGGNAGGGSGNAQQAWQGAQDISSDLSDKLSTTSNLYGFFSDMSHQNSVRMFGDQVTTEVLPGDGWQTALMDRGCESNIILNGAPPYFNLPPDYTLPPGVYTKSKRGIVPMEALNYYFLKGYEPLTIGNKTFWQVPFQYDQKPHLVSKSWFDKARPFINPPLWVKPVPNAFSTEGVATKGDTGEKAMSFVLTNPRQPIQLSIPHGFVHIHMDDMQSHWFFYPAGPPPVPPVEYGNPQTYGYSLDTESASMPQGGPFSQVVDSGDITVGNDVAFKSLNDVIFTDYCSNKDKIEKYLVNRINEMVAKPGVSYNKVDLHNILGAQSTANDLVNGERDFYLYSPDGEKIVCKSKSDAVKVAWLAPLISHNPDGNEDKLVDDANKSSNNYIPVITPNDGCSVDTMLGWSNIHEDVYWTTSTGFNSNLGLLRVKHWTNNYSLGVCSPG